MPRFPGRARKILDKQGPWNAHDYLTKCRREVDEFFVYRYSRWMQVFGKLIAQEKLLSLKDLEGLEGRKLEAIRKHVLWFSQ